MYIAYLLSLPLTETILLELGISERVDTLYNAYKKINISAEREFKQLGYQDCLKDIGEKQAKSQFKTKQDEEYINNKIIQDTQRIKREAQTGLNKKELKVNDSLLDRMNNEWLRINKDKYSGYMERLAELGYNYGYVKCCIDYGIEQVQFIAIEDNRTTHMCDSLAGQVFNIKGKNEFYRYYASSNNVELTTTIGLVQGINMPPIDDSFHWCRSYLQAVKQNKPGKELKTPTNYDKIKEILSKDERYAINKYISSDFYVINEKLRNNIELSKEEKTICNDLDKALEKIPNYSGNVRRSLLLNDEQLKTFLEKYQIGQEVTCHAYTSTTKGKRYNLNSNVELYIMDSKLGKNMLKYNKGEQEILYKRDSKFLVKEIEKLNDTYHILLEEVKT